MLYLQTDALHIVVIIQDGMLAGSCGIRGDGAPVEDAVAVPEHLHPLAKVLEALRLRVHRAPAVGRSTAASAAQSQNIILHQDCSHRARQQHLQVVRQVHPFLIQR